MAKLKNKLSYLLALIAPIAAVMPLSAQDQPKAAGDEEEAAKKAKIREDAARARREAKERLSPKTSATYVKEKETTQNERLASKSHQVKTALDSILREAEFTFSRNYTAFFKQTRSVGWFDSLKPSAQQISYLSQIRNYREVFNSDQRLSNMSIFNECEKVIQELKNISNTMMNKLHILGDLNRNETQYVKPADAGPNKKRVDIVPDATPLSLVINASSPVA